MKLKTICLNFETRSKSPTLFISVATVLVTLPAFGDSIDKPAIRPIRSIVPGE